MLAVLYFDNPCYIFQIILKHTQTRSQKWLQKKFAKRIESAKSPEEVFSLYKELTEEVRKGPGYRIKIDDLKNEA